MDETGFFKCFGTELVVIRLLAQPVAANTKASAMAVQRRENVDVISTSEHETARVGAGTAKLYSSLRNILLTLMTG